MSRLWSSGQAMIRAGSFVSRRHWTHPTRRTDMWPAASVGLSFQVRYFAAPTASDTRAPESDTISSSVTASAKEWWESFRSLSGQAVEYSNSVVIPSLEHWWTQMDPASMQGLVPTTVSLASCAAAWFVLPRLLRRLHSYVEQGPTARLLGYTQRKVSYDMTVWAALEDPIRAFLTLVALAQLAALVAPTSVEGYLLQVWRGGLALNMVWFLHRWKTVAFQRVLMGKSMTKEDQERYLAFDKASTVAIIVLGAVTMAEVSGVAVQSILTVGGIGGIATAFAARDILGNALSGFILQFIKPFSVGDIIAAGNIEGQVLKMGLHSTSLLNGDKYPMMVPNSFFSSQVIINKSRSSKQTLKSRMYMRFSDIDKLPGITAQVLELLKAHPKVMLDKEEPLCYLSKTAPTHLEMTLAYDIHPLSKLESAALEQEILVRAAEIVKNSGATLGAAA